MPGYFGGGPAGNQALEGQVQQSLTPYMQGGPGSSPMLDAATAAFQAQVLPVMQNQMTLAGVSESPLAVQAYGNALGANLVPLIQNDMQNQLEASRQAAALSGQQFQQSFLPAQLAQQRELEMGSQALTGRGIDVQQQLGLGGQAIERELGLGQLGLGRQGLSQQAAVSAADIADREAMRQMQAYMNAGGLIQGLSNPYAQAMQGQQQQQQTGLTGYSQAGALQQMTQQQYLDALRLEMLRLQGMSEQGSYGVFGGAAVPPALGSTANTSGSTSK